MKKFNLQTITVFVLVLLVASLMNFGCKGDSPNSSEDSSDSSGSQNTASNTSASGPLVGQWIVGLDATAAYHGLGLFGGGYTDAERTAYEAASFEFTGSKFKYSLRDKSGEVGYTVKSVTDQSVIIEMPGGITPTLTFILRPDGKLVLPQDPRWDMLVLKKK